MPRRRARSGRDARALVLAVALLASVATPCVASPGTRVARAAASDADDGTARSSRAPGRALLEPRAAVPSSAVDWSAWRYRSNDEVAAALEHLHRGPCAGTSALTSMGASGKGVPMRVLEISLEPGRVSAKPSFAFIGNMHGDEPVGRELILRLGKLLCDALREPEEPNVSAEDPDEDPDLAKHLASARSLARSARLFLAPTINPDGFAMKKRGNARGKDLNRDFPDQFDHPGMPDDPVAGAPRQPETRAVMRWSRGVNATGALNFHEGAVVANYPWDGTEDRGTRYSEAPDDAAFRRLALGYAKGHPTMHRSAQFEGGVTNGARWYPLRGGMQDWHYIQTGTFDVTVEVCERKWPPEATLKTLWREHRGGILEAARIGTLATARGVVRDAATNAPLADAAVTAVPKGEGNDDDGRRQKPMVFATNALGFYARPVPFGAVTLTAGAPGYESVTIEAEVAEDLGAEVHFELRRVGGGAPAIEAEEEEEAIEAEEEKKAGGTTTKTTDANSATETTETTKANVSAPVPSHVSAPVPSHVSAPVPSRGDDKETAATPPRRNSSEEELLRRAMELSMEESRDSNRERSATTTTISVSTSATSVSTPETVGRSAAAAERAVIEYFLADSASQLTRRGLADARDRIRERELVVFFRNNHFSTVFKLDGALYLLVTDQGYLGEPDVVWEVLASSRASAETGTFVDAHFKPFVCHADPTAAAASARTEEDAQLAAALLASAAEARGGSGAASAEATRQPTASTRQPPALIPEGFLRVPSDEAPSAIPEGGHGEEGGRGGEGSRGRDSALASAPLASPGDSDYALAMALQAEYEAEAAREEAAARARREEASRATAGREVGGRASAPTRTAASSRPPQRRAPRRKKSAYDECAVM